MELKDIVKDAVIISENATFEEALKKMVREQTNSLLVIGENGELVGEVEVSDILDAVVPEYLDGDSITDRFTDEESFVALIHDAKDKLVKEFMTMDPNPVLITDGLLEVASSAISHQQARIPVVDHENRPIGVISRRGLKHIVARHLGIKDKK